MNYVSLFPGQGSQSVGMGKFLHDNFQSTKLLFEEASDTLNQNFKKLCFEDPNNELNLTANTQPALLLVSTATFNAVQEMIGQQPNIGMGHSVGEYAALVTAQSLKFSDAMKAVRQRGEAMQSAVPVGQGGMIAVMGLSPEQTIQLCQYVEKESGYTPLEPANYNAPGQIVISGNAKAIEWALKNVSKEIFSEAPKRMKLIPLKVSAPFHCTMMKPAEEKMKSVLADIKFNDAIYPIVQNFCAEKVIEAKKLQENLVHQVSGAVRWIESAELVANENLMTSIEFGTGNVLSGLMKKINSDFKVYSTNNLDDLKVIESELKG